MEAPDTPKRYVLLVADAELTTAEANELSTLLERRYGKVKLIEVEGNRSAIIVKTTNEVAPLLREAGAALKVGRKGLSTVLTSGAVGKLKKRASGVAANGKVP